MSNDRVAGSPQSDDPRHIEADIERTRAGISDTLHRIEGKLSPGQLMDQALDFVRGGQLAKAGGEFASNLGSVVRGNPVPLALIGIGIAWLALSSPAGRSSGRGTQSPISIGSK